MKSEHFYFIKDEFYDKFKSDSRLMQNKKNGNKRPCFIALTDKKNPDLLWCVPISSQVEKFEKIYNAKIEKQIAKGQTNPKCDTIRFGEVLGKKRAFLIQNIFPVSKRYIESVYVDKNTQDAVAVDETLKKDIINHSKKVLKAAVRNPGIVFTDIEKIRCALEKELLEQKELSSASERSTENKEAKEHISGDNKTQPGQQPIKQDVISGSAPEQIEKERSLSLSAVEPKGKLSMRETQSNRLKLSETPRSRLQMRDTASLVKPNSKMKNDIER